MSATAQHTLLQAIAAALLATPALAEGRVYTNRTRPVSAVQPTAINVRLERSAGNVATLGAIDWATTVVVECVGRATAGADPSAVVDPMLADAWARLSALSPSSLGLMHMDVGPAIEWDYDEADSPQAAATVRVTASHRTPAATLDPWT